MKMMSNKELREIYKTNQIRCTNCGMLKIVAQKLEPKSNLGFGCCVPFQMLPNNWGTSDAAKWILDLRE